MTIIIPRGLITGGIVVLGVTNIVMAVLVTFASDMDVAARGFIGVWAVFGIVAMVRELINWVDSGTE